MIGTMPPSRPATPPGINATDYSVMVLLVDDQVMVAEAIRRCLANQPNIDFHYCIDPTEAVRLANQIKPTVILQDLVMPGIDGIAATYEIRRIEITEALKMTPIVAMTAHVLDQDRALAKAAGMQDFLIKPVSADEFERVLSRFL